MTSSAVTELVCAHSPDSDDAYMFYGLATKKVRSRLVTFRHVLEDIESLNRKAMQGTYELTPESYHAYPYIADKYVLMAAGSSVGDGYGPVLVSNRPMAPDEIQGKRIAIPGMMTSPYLTMRLMEPDFEAVVMPVNKILDAVHDHAVDLGLVIHEGQLTYSKSGFHAVVDLGKWWKQQHNMPLPLGANVLLRSLSPEIQSECCRLLSASIKYSLDHHEESINYAMQFARDLDFLQAEKFFDIYLNHSTLNSAAKVPLPPHKI